MSAEKKQYREDLRGAFKGVTLDRHLFSESLYGYLREDDTHTLQGFLEIMNSVAEEMQTDLRLVEDIITVITEAVWRNIQIERKTVKNIEEGADKLVEKEVERLKGELFAGHIDPLAIPESILYALRKVLHKYEQRFDVNAPEDVSNS